MLHTRRRVEWNMVLSTRKRSGRSRVLLVRVERQPACLSANGLVSSGIDATQPKTVAERACPAVVVARRVVVLQRGRDVGDDDGGCVGEGREGMVSDEEARGGRGKSARNSRGGERSSVVAVVAVAMSSSSSSGSGSGDSGGSGSGRRRRRRRMRRRTGRWQWVWR